MISDSADMPRNVLCYSGHAVRRMVERGITERQVEETVMRGELLSLQVDKAIWGKGRLRAVVNLTGMFITAWREKRYNPKRSFQKRRSQLRKLFGGR